MNDRFKFRGYSPEKKALLEDISVYSDGSWRGCIRNSTDDLVCGYGDEDGSILMQCTGLKDIRGKLIYEGDIVKADEEILELGSNIGIVGFQKAQYCIRDEEWDNTDFITNYKLEVIGNIYIDNFKNYAA